MELPSPSTCGAPHTAAASPPPPKQVLSLNAITANGTQLTVTPQSNPHLFKALGGSVGRLGVVTELTLRIRPQMAVTKSLQELNFQQFAQQVKVRRPGCKLFCVSPLLPLC